MRRTMYYFLVLMDQLVKMPLNKLSSLQQLEVTALAVTKLDGTAKAVLYCTFRPVQKSSEI
jgi:hypothetical protein